jgi:hypothetical protein
VSSFDNLCIIESFPFVVVVFKISQVQGLTVIYNVGMEGTGLL